MMQSDRIRVLSDRVNRRGGSGVPSVISRHSIESTEVFRYKFFEFNPSAISFVTELYPALNERCSGPPTYYI